MPRVVIELQANTQDAVNKIQQFAKAQRDAFDAIRAGNPALADATVKVSALKEAYTGATAAAKQFALQGPPAAASIQTITTALTDARGAVVAYGTATAAGKAASAKFYDELAAGSAKSSAALGQFRSVAQGLAADIPVVGGEVSRLAGALGGFPLLLGGIVGAGLGFLKMLQGWSQEADKALASIQKLSAGIQSQFQQAVLEVQKIRAQAAGDEAKAITLGAEQALKAAEDVKNARIAKAQEAVDALDLLGRKSREAEDAFYRESLAAEAEFQGKRMVIEAQGLADLDKLGQDRLAKRKQQLEDETKAAAEAAEKQQKLLEDLKGSALKTFQGLGEGFEDVVKSLELAAFVEKTQAQIAELNKGIELGIDTHGRFAAGVQALQEKMAEAIQLGYVPTIEKAKELGAAIEETGKDAVSAGERWLQSIAGISSALDAIIAKSRAAAAAAAGGAAAGGAAAPVSGGGGISAGGGPSTGVYGGRFGGSVIGNIANQPSGSGLQPFNPKYNIPHFPHGGIVPGSGPVPIIAHGGEQILPAGGRSGAGGGIVRIEPGAIQISGTVIDQSRDWDVLVESLGQALAARLR